jgi:hypothetical protein
MCHNRYMNTVHIADITPGMTVATIPSRVSGMRTRIVGKVESIDRYDIQGESFADVKLDSGVTVTTYSGLYELVAPAPDETDAMVDELNAAYDLAAYGRVISEPTAAEPVCEDDGEPLSAHIGGKPCVVGEPSGARAWYDLPMAAAMWSADGRATRG